MMNCSNGYRFFFLAIVAISLLCLSGCFFTKLATSEWHQFVKEPLIAKEGFVTHDNKLLFCVYPLRSNDPLKDSAAVVVDLSEAIVTHKQPPSNANNRIPINYTLIELTGGDLKNQCPSLAVDSHDNKKIYYWKYLSKSELMPSDMMMEKAPVVYALPDGKLIYSDQSYDEQDYYGIEFVKKRRLGKLNSKEVALSVAGDIITFPIQLLLVITTPEARPWLLGD